MYILVRSLSLSVPGWGNDREINTACILGPCRNNRQCRGLELTSQCYISALVRLASRCTYLVLSQAYP